MAYDSYAPLYTGIKRQLMQERDRVGYAVLDVLAQHCDPYGFCFPHPRTIAELAGYAEASVWKKLAELQERGWIICYQTWNPRRSRYEYDFQLSPDVLYIREDLLEEAWQRWEAGLKQSVMKYHEPESEPDSEPKPEPKPDPALNPDSEPNSNPALNPPPPLKPFEGEKRGFSTDERPVSPKALKNTAKPPKQRVAPSPTAHSAAHDSQGNVPIFQDKLQNEWQRAALEAYHQPLAVTEAESLAHVLKDEFGSRLTQTRQIVDAFGHQSVETAMRFVRSELKRGRTVTSPVGLVLWWLKNNVISETDAQSIQKDWTTASPSRIDFSQFVET